MVLQRCDELGLLRTGGRVRTDATHVLACIRDLNRLEFVTETMRCALEALAAAAPQWLVAAGAVSPEWVRRYGKRADSYRLPKGEAERAAFAVQVGADGYRLLDLAGDGCAPTWLATVPAVAVLRQVWDQQYCRDGKQAAWRDKKDLPPGTDRLVSPHDCDARCGVKRTTVWDGYKTHYTEACDDDAPHLITAVDTVPAPIDDSRRIPGLHAQLTAAGRTPAEHFVDAGYTSALLIVEAAEQGIDLVGPVPAAGGRQAHAGNGYALADFHIDWDQQQLTCPQGKTSTRWIDTRIDGQPRIHVDFYGVGCLTCPAGGLHHRRLPRPDTAPARTARNTRPTPHRTANPCLARPLRHPGRRRGHHLPGCAPLQRPTVPLPRPAQDPTGTSPDRVRRQPRQTRRLVDRHPTRSNPDQPLHPTRTRPHRIKHRNQITSSNRVLQASCTNTNTPPNQLGRHYRQAQSPGNP